MENNMNPLRFVVIGLGGWALDHIMAVEWLEEKGWTQLAGVVALESDRHKQPEWTARLTARKTPLFDNIDDFFERGLDLADVLTVPIGIHQHVPVSIRALEAGLHVFCEKPIAGTIQEVDQLIAARDKARRRVAIGFQHLYANTIRQLKQRIASGALGAPESASLYCGWPRALEYFRRNDWAGKLRHDGAWILDSPANNAMAHYIMNLLYLTSAEPHAAAQPTRLQAELYRAYPIESTDTVQLRFETDTGVACHVFLSHASEVEMGPMMRLQFEKGEIAWFSHEGQAEIHYADGRKEQFDNRHDKWRYDAFYNFARSLLFGDALICPPEVGRAHTLTISAMHESCPDIVSIPADDVFAQEDWMIYPKNTRGHFHRVKSLGEWMVKAAQEHVLLSEMGVPWARAGREVVLDDYDHFPKPGWEFGRQWQ